MDILKESEIVHELYFYPRYDKYSWEENWVRKISKEIGIIYEEIKSYVDIREKPPIFFLQKPVARYTRSQLKLPWWTKAFTYKNAVYVLSRQKSFNDKNADWRNLIAHEMFHAGVNQVCCNQLIIPGWFNEAIAYYIGRDIYKDKKIHRFLHKNKEEIIRLLEEDTLLDRKKGHYFKLIKSFGTFFVTTYGPGRVRSLISDAAQLSDFYRALKDELQPLVSRWCDWLTPC